MNRTGRVGALLAASLAVASLGTLSNAVDPAREGIRQIVGDATPASAKARAQKATPSRTGERNRIAKALFGGPLSGNRRRRYPNGPGWTQAHVQRLAKKRRNRAKNRAAHR